MLFRSWEDELVNLEVARVADASGKEDLGGGVLVGITLKLLNWKIKFEDRVSLTTCVVSGGNLVAVDSNGNSMYPIEPSENTTVTIAQSSSSTMLQDSDIDAIKSKTDNLPSDPASTTNVAVVEVSLDEAKRHTGTFEPETESLEAIRTRLDEVYAKPSGGVAFRV